MQDLEAQRKLLEQIISIETKIALNKLSSNSAEEVAEKFSHRIVQKILDPLIMSLKESIEIEYDPALSQKQYLDNYYNKFNRPSDHVS